MRWARAIAAFVAVFLGAVLLAALAGAGIGQFELLLILFLAGVAAFAASRPGFIRLRRTV
jgi:hypothetical protein